jgi:DNA-binding LytR/AlgR family response regulator
VDTIRYITANPPYINIHTDQQKFLHTGSLRSIATVVDPSIFVRVHRSTIVNILQVESYVTRLNGDYDLLMKNKIKLRLSRNYAAAFKLLYQQTHPLTTK